ncbi:MAG: hypothetical protein AAGG51_17545 [Cyanobacteria bacterium P01_G01_bin.54]
MLEITLNWKPDPDTLTQLVQVALQKHQSLETLLDEAIQQYLQTNPIAESEPTHDPLIGLYNGTPDLSTQAEDILSREIKAGKMPTLRKSTAPKSPPTPLVNPDDETQAQTPTPESLTPSAPQ